MPVVKPGVIVDHAVVQGELADVYNFMADFSNSALWDPGVVTAARDQQGDVKVGSTFSLVVEFNGNKSDMVYEIAEMDPNKRVVIDGESSKITAEDVMTFSVPEAGKVRIDYTATIKIKGCAKIFIGFLNSKFDALGRNAMNGIESYFAKKNSGDVTAK